CHQGNSFPWTF
nr:immunoglobulin light chain junction region [Macaca mulatta]MOV79487.1 immunoglobulin light chain junction region [Macaca mulatta]MOV80520.1 immunoglobulin light chain junction region [Macaca mulatta]MOV84040.1 immunoglobulin light chain junction region [Macaca mulatta]MOV86025.1 immunoglobulin light chain junction region [Macaca mulatta]